MSQCVSDGYLGAVTHRMSATGELWTGQKAVIRLVDNLIETKMGEVLEMMRVVVAALSRPLVDGITNGARNPTEADVSST